MPKPEVMTCVRHGRSDCETCLDEAVGLRNETNVPWRCGQESGRTIYAQFGDEPNNVLDPLIGTMDTPTLARAVVRDHNAALERSASAGTPKR